MSSALRKFVSDGNATKRLALVLSIVVRNVVILYRGDVVATIPVKLEKGGDSEFVAEAVRHALRLGTFRDRSLTDIDFKVSAPLPDPPAIN